MLVARLADSVGSASVAIGSVTVQPVSFLTRAVVSPPAVMRTSLILSDSTANTLSLASRRQARASRSRRSRCRRQVPRGRGRARWLTTAPAWLSASRTRCRCRPRTPGRDRNTDSMKMRLCASAVSVRRRSSGSRGRMAIRFSCCASQFTVFRKKSRLPCTPSTLLVAKSESPITTTRDLRLARLLAGRGVRLRLRRRCVGRRGGHRRAERDRPGPIALVRVQLHAAVALAERREIGFSPSSARWSAPATAACAHSTPPSTASTDRASGYAVIS